MIVRSLIWRSAVVLSTLALTLPVWMQSGRADPLYLVPLLGWTTLAFMGRPTEPKPSPTRLVRTIAFTALAVGALTWAASGTFALGQIALLALSAMPLAFLHRWIAADHLLLRRIILHALPVILWVPVGMALADASYRWPTTIERPRVALLSSLPLVWGSASGDLFSTLQGGGASAPIYALLQDAAVVEPIDSVTAGTLRTTQVLLMIQPRALPPDALVAIDDWVRQGGRVLWLADPVLASGGDFPLGDRRNPDIREANTALLARWGLRLQPSAITSDGLTRVHEGGLPLVLHSPGRLLAISPACRLSASALLAECQIGQGRAVILADADMISAELWTRSDLGNGHHPHLWTSANAQWVITTLLSLAGARGQWRVAEPVWLRPALSR